MKVDYLKISIWNIYITSSLVKYLLRTYCVQWQISILSQAVDIGIIRSPWGMWQSGCRDNLQTVFWNNLGWSIKEIPQIASSINPQLEYFY